MSFFDCFVETILNNIVHIKLVVSKLGNEVFDYSQVSFNTGQVEGITIVLKDKVIPVIRISDFTHKQFSNVKLNHKIETIYRTSQIALSCEVVIIVMLNVCNTVEEHLGLGNIGLESWQIFSA